MNNISQRDVKLAQLIKSKIFLLQCENLTKSILLDLVFHVNSKYEENKLIARHSETSNFCCIRKQIETSFKRIKM